ncbi:MULTISPECIES: BON domain-containing protein [unclassified Cupriavidus]|uniref:BON domain-containing protein n=1 Tax=unclassified Cupriavidus TaxID=2640874 RepID=UPI00041269CB|nr:MULTISPECIES: BON domain-containing protein [unclassified Cupriavidus]MBP0631556.1 BON domain-containing protein [Cupriavidus sp. AcVe19-1a]
MRCPARSRIRRLALPLAVLVMAAAPAVPAAPTDAPAAPSSTGRTAAPRDTAIASDRAITSEVRARLASAGTLDPAKIRVSTMDGVVKLEGSVRDDKQRALAMELARSVRGVTAVSDELRAGTD